MTVQAFSPVLSELPYGRINGKVATETADADGWYYKPGDTVKISADQTFAKCTASSDFVAGLVEAGLNSHDTGGTLGANERVGVVLLKGRRVDIVPAAEELAAGDLVAINYLGAAAKVSAAAGTTPETTVHGTLAAQEITTDAQTDLTGTVADTACTITIPAGAGDLAAVTAESEDLTVVIPALAVSGALDASIHGIVWKGGASGANVEIIVF